MIGTILWSSPDNANWFAIVSKAGSAPPTQTALTDAATIIWTPTVSGSEASVTLGGNRTLNIGGNAIGHFALHVTQDGTGSRTLMGGTYNSVANTILLAANGLSVLALSSTAGYVDDILLDCDGTSCYASGLGKQYTASAPTTLPSSVSGLIGWYSADCVNAGACTGQPSNGASLSTWNDRSTSGNNMTCGNPPVFNTNQLNTLPAVSFTAASYEYCQPSNITSSTIQTFFAVLKLNSVTYGVVSSFIGYGASPGGSYGLQVNNSSHVELDSEGTTLIGAGTAVVSASTYYQTDVTYDGTNWAIRFNRAADASGTNAVSFSNPVNGIPPCWSGSACLDGQLVEMFAYNSVVSGGNISALEAYLHTKYGI